MNFRLKSHWFGTNGIATWVDSDWLLSILATQIDNELKSIEKKNIQFTVKSHRAWNLIEMNKYMYVCIWLHNISSSFLSMKRNYKFVTFVVFFSRVFVVLLLLPSIFCSDLVLTCMARLPDHKTAFSMHDKINVIVCAFLCSYINCSKKRSKCTQGNSNEFQ